MRGLEQEFGALDDALGAFTEKMREKLRDKAHDMGGWDEPWAEMLLRRKLADRVVVMLLDDSPQEVDIANFAMFLFHFRSKRNGQAKNRRAERGRPAS